MLSIKIKYLKMMEISILAFLCVLLWLVVLYNFNFSDPSLRKMFVLMLAHTYNVFYEISLNY